MSQMQFSEILEIIKDKSATDSVCRRADEIRRAVHGNFVQLRGIIEFSNYCNATCRYCGLNHHRKNLHRYVLDWERLVDLAGTVAARGFKTIVLQSGQNPAMETRKLAIAVEQIKNRFDVRITLSCGEWDYDTYRMWREAGADRYLLKLETANAELYSSLHPHMSHANRRRCLNDLFKLGYQVGSGNLVGLPGQTAEHLAEDIVDFAQYPYEMISVGPLIPSEHTDLAGMTPPPMDLPLRVLALARINAPEAHMPTTTALCSISKEARVRALQSGANVVMINFTPRDVSKDYNIYEKSACGGTENCMECTRQVFADLGLTVSEGFGDGMRAGRN